MGLVEHKLYTYYKIFFTCQHMEAASVSFFLADEADIRKWSVGEITSGDLYKKDQHGKERPIEGGLRDKRLGTSRRGRCVVCNMGWSDCPGHFGHIELAEPVYHPGLLAHVMRRLKCICRTCHVAHMKPKKKCLACGELMCTVERTSDHGLRFRGEVLLASEALQWMGVTSAQGIFTNVMPIAPTTIRITSVAHGNEVRGEDSITKQLLTIVRINNALKKLKKTNAVTRVRNAVVSFQREVGNYLYRSSTKPEACIAERLRKKEGRVRGTLMGKRCNFTARSVITGDPTLHMSEVGVPHEVADKLTVKERVHRYNIDALRKKLSSCKYAIDPNGKRIDLQWSRMPVRLEPGWILERPLKDGDIVLFNRQPSLHRPSMMCHRVRRMEGKTFRLNLSCTTPYNADFDGKPFHCHQQGT